MHSAHIIITETVMKYLKKMRKHLQVKLTSFCEVNAAVIRPIDQNTSKLHRPNNGNETNCGIAACSINTTPVFRVNPESFRKTKRQLYH